MDCAIGRCFVVLEDLSVYLRVYVGVRRRLGGGGPLLATHQYNKYARHRKALSMSGR